MRRPNLLAKQVISIQSALYLGFTSQLWVDTTSWVVLVVEVRPNLLAGESERFLLVDVSQVGYRFLTLGRQNIGKEYSFNINSGAVESLELDSFGISFIPSSLMSAYALLVENVLKVVSNTAVVHDAAASRIQRLTKGLWDNQNAGTLLDDLGEYSEFERSVRSGCCQNIKRSFRSKKSHPEMRETEDDWELPMDYL